MVVMDQKMLQWIDGLNGHIIIVNNQVAWSEHGLSDFLNGEVDNPF